MTTQQPPECVDLWFVFTEQIPDDVARERYYGLLTDAERSQQARFHFARDRHRYLLTRALVRTTLSQYCAVSPEDWRFNANPQGRPEICDEQQPALPLRFNVSHTQGLIVLAIAAGRQIGVDTENVRERAAPLDIAERFFAPAEVAALAALPPAERPDRFYHHWTLKESYIKARGLGLSIPLDRFHFDFLDDARIRLLTDAQLQDSPSRWRLRLLQVASDFMLALCVERVSAAPLELRMACALHRELPLAQRLLRSSE